MGRWWFNGLVLLGLVMLMTGIDGYPVENLVVRLPGQPKVDFRQFAVMRIEYRQNICFQGNNCIATQFLIHGSGEKPSLWCKIFGLEHGEFTCKFWGTQEGRLEELLEGDAEVVARSKVIGIGRSGVGIGGSAVQDDEGAGVRTEERV
ncbi:hypothetical protein HHK36_033131 [Tetracentron sinense]|uniref:Uncharacterized protein n=1 Tax=Tetracentron sinense TaxID=13715 RepID=A0A834Y4E5_TETSI|nr:hypothetical protein HHK36_033131 [Tetracentron sinense]